jgi:arylsulfatase A-like enzyme
MVPRQHRKHSRRNLLKAAASFVVGGPALAVERRPNILLVMTDEQRWDTIGAGGYPWMITPHLDRLAREGVLFRNAYCPSPVCVASRASFHYGLYPPATGVYRNGHAWDGSREWMWSLREGGYHCASIGKNHYTPVESKRCAWHERVIVENKNGSNNHQDAWDQFLAAHGIPQPPKRFGAHTWEWPEETHADSFIADTVARWIDRYTGRAPFLLWACFAGPHTPHRSAAEVRRTLRQSQDAARDRKPRGTGRSSTTVIVGSTCMPRFLLI